MKKLAPIHPGEILAEDFMKPSQLTNDQLSKKLDIPVQQVEAITRGEVPITPAIAIGLAKCFGTSPDVWLGLQRSYDSDVASDKTAPNSK